MEQLPAALRNASSLSLTNRQIDRPAPAPLGQQETLLRVFLPEMLFPWHLLVHKLELKKSHLAPLVLEIQGNLWGNGL